MSLPAAYGFVLSIGDAARPSPTAAPRADAAPVELTTAGLVAQGWVTGPLAGSDGSAVARTDGCAVLVAGELYHRERWVECGLPDLSGHSDAEAVLVLWRRYGTAALRLLEGRFAVVLLDGSCALVATDHAGSIPLYTAYTDRGVLVSTRARDLGGAATTAPGPAVLGVTSPVRQLRGVRRVHAGHLATVLGSREERAAVATWAPPAHRELWRPADAVAAVREALRASVTTRLRGPATVVLSGGIDSSGVAGTAHAAGGTVRTVSMGTDVGNEFAAARQVVDHLGVEHDEVHVDTADLLAMLPHVVAAAEVAEPDILEYLLPLTALYGRLPGPPRRVLTGYGADIPLGGMHRETDRLDRLDLIISEDLAGFDGLNEMTPDLTGATGHWTTHPYFDRSLLDLLVRLEPAVKRREGIDKWVLRRACADLLPEATVRRPKLGVHEGSGTTSSWSARLLAEGVRPDAARAAKRAMAEDLYRAVVVDRVPADEVDLDVAWRRATEIAEVTA